jgi:asparagine synthase (glutamine-hydrolysing)
MKSLWAMGLPRQLNGTLLLNYLTAGYVQNPIKKTDTFFSNILSLPPGHYLTVLPSQGRVQMRRWYMPVNASPENLISTNSTEEETIEKFSELFFTSVKRRLRCDVTLGASLSGGLDSASIAAAVHSITHSSFPVFTASFTGFEKDETTRSKETANHFSLQQYLISPTANDWVNNWQKLTYHQEEPMQSSSVLTQFMVYGLAKEKRVTVLLDGQGADEILGGYQKYPQWYLQQLLLTDRKAFYMEKKLLQQHDFLDHWNWRNYAASIFPGKVALHLQQRVVHQQNQHPFIQSDFLRQYQNADTLQKPEVRQLEDMLYYNTFQVGLQELLRYADRNSMAQSIEVRLPFLNHELVEFVFSLPSSYKIKEGFTKWILRKSMEQLLPTDIAWSNGKIGYEPPQQLWMQQAPIQEMIHEARKTLVDKFILKPGILEESIHARPSHAKDNFDWRFLCAAELFNTAPKTY